jgi:hypothetical protein
MKRNSTYKMSKALKTSLTLGRYKNKQHRDEWKNIMINAEIYGNSVERHTLSKPVAND